MRKKRLYSDIGFYHTVIRGVNKQIIFFEAADKEYFLFLLKKFAKKYCMKVHAYCLMDNHVHLLLQDSNKNLSPFMQLLASVYARYFNRKYDRIGHLYQDRFASEIISNNSYLVVVFRYIIQNPKKAGLCQTNNFKWNSYNSYRKNKTFIETSLLKNIFGNINKLYKYLNDDNDDECLDISLRPSEKELYYIEKIKKLLKSHTPVINMEQSKTVIKQKIKILREAGLSIRVISRTTGISIGIIQRTAIS